MKKVIILFMILPMVSLYAQTKISWVTTTQKEQWKEQRIQTSHQISGSSDVEVEVNKPQQTIEGFGTCFNEQGWVSLSFLSPKERNSIFRELFAPGVGANFTICRMPLGANDFSMNWYSYNETDGDFEMKDFNISNDLKTLVPFIKNAQKYNPSLRLWASPWSPPTWMKYNHHYAGLSVLGNSKLHMENMGIDMRGINNGLTKDKQGKEGTDMFIQEEKYYKAYALYFAKFIEAYRKQKIKIGMVMPQNEFNSSTVYPSCTWTPEGLTKFISFLGPQMQQLGVKVYFGTVERANAKLVEPLLTNPISSKYIQGVGFQWEGKDAMSIIHKQYPELTLYQSEQECGNGKNDWKNCVHSWDLMKHYINDGANAYMYWNTSLKTDGISKWGWKQNSLITVDSLNRTYKFTYEYYLMKHVSHFVKPSAKLLQTTGSFTNILAFINPDKSVVLVVQNETDQDKEVRIKVGEQTFSPLLKADSFNTFLLK
ncbi:glycoside hydrolase family 30 protein [Flavobacterium notoginsengisoli]|uniref:glycoside hydrolase family 30 protein n=1 Tax=Flavobacterium notoginsengisoli TaxID=1478199 RepID=UPI0036348D55